MPKKKKKKIVLKGLVSDYQASKQASKQVSSYKLQAGNDLSRVMDPLEGPNNMDWASRELVSSQETPSFEDGGWEEVDSDMDSSCKSNEIQGIH